MPRRARVPPLLDDKVLTSWNGLMLAAMADGARILGDERYHRSAERAAQFALCTLITADGALLRTARAGRARLPGYLEDYAFLADGLLFNDGKPHGAVNYFSHILGKFAGVYRPEDVHINELFGSLSQLEHFSIIRVHSLQRRSSWRIRLA